ncbi:hypothetical protein SPOG_01707 [Schizosaccharomyces cryophilus OY26]|uniref:Uncharacterized protein n=1 Tax=Schizosaccharomyces cryophilus (strain OY26 / ATCC MYA-4695 / CBS 11777 / NBRC 106824 / NRRL Y48691) TaxID=653667 RepID=S9XFI6_SCHCR|nr:uncharacterized protein SPOG_01707 [Schizosaccharomyces cryophilus OY26]EPY52381.1 hypothetical protein SPOG_01707 [Schizosaccharomyces cryophilus OY26]
MSSFTGKSSEMASKAKKYMSSPGSVQNTDQNFSNQEQTRSGGNFDNRFSDEERGYSNADQSAAPEYSHPSQGDPYSGQTADTKRGFSSQRSGGRTDYGNPRQSQGYTQSTEYGGDQGEDYGRNYGGSGGSYGSTGGASAGDYGTSGDYSTSGDYGGGNRTSTYNAGNQDVYNRTSSLGDENQYGRTQSTSGASQGNYNTTGDEASYQTSGNQGKYAQSGNLGEEGQYGSRATQHQPSSGSKSEGYNAGRYTTDPNAASSRAGGADQAGQNLTQSGGQRVNQAESTGRHGVQGTKSQAQDLGNEAQQHASFTSKMKGSMEKMFGKMTRDEELVQKGENMKTGGGGRL